MKIKIIICFLNSQSIELTDYDYYYVDDDDAKEVSALWKIKRKKVEEIRKKKKIMKVYKKKKLLLLSHLFRCHPYMDNSCCFSYP